MTAPGSLGDSRHVDELSVAFLASRTRILLWIILIGNVLFAVTDPWLNPHLLAPLELVKVVVITTQIVGLLLSRSVSTRRGVSAIGVVCGAVAAFASVVAGAITNDHLTTPLLCLAGILTSAAVMPWGAATQAVATALAWLAVLINAALAGGLAAAGYPLMGIVMGGVISVYVADELQRQRVARRGAARALQLHQDELAHVLRLSTMGEMAAHLAHELTQPLWAISNYAAGCRRRLEGRPDASAELVEVLDEIGREAMRAGEIIHRMRGFVRKAGPQRVPVDVNTLVRNVTRLVDAEAREHNVCVRLALAGDMPPVFADAIQVEQVTINLIRNALEAVQRSPADARELAIETSFDGEQIEVAVRDSGPGIPPGESARVFEPFYTTKPTGLGMGLAISRSLVEAHGGCLWLTANQGPGVTFRFRLPLRPGQAAADGARAPRQRLGCAD